MLDLAQTLLSEELRALNRARRSGVLTVASREVTKGIFLRAGRIVFASSTLDKDKLGENLIRLGRISRAQFAAAYDATRDGGGRLGEALVGAGILTEEELGRLVAHQAQKIVLSVFTWTAGEMSFHEAAEPIPADLALDLSTQRLLFEGARIYPDVQRLEDAIGSTERRIRVALRAPFDVTRFAFSPAEKAVLDDAGQEMRISDILARASSRPLLVRAVYALLVGGVVEDVGQEGGEFVEQETGTFRVAVAAPPETSPDLRERILHLYESMPRATHYEILGVPLEAGDAEIHAAYRRLTEEQDREWRDLLGDVRLSSMVSTLQLRRQEAYQALADPQRRATYDRSLGGPLPDLRTTRPTVDAQARAARLVRDAQALVMRGDYQAAIPLLLESVDLNPEDFLCRRLLAVSLARHPLLFRTAERHFITALELDPRDVDLRYRLALYYRRLGLAARAVVQLEAVLAAHPGHDGAQRELRSLR